MAEIIKDSKESDIITNATRLLSEEDEKKLKEQDSRLIPEFKATKLELDARRHWDLFYKRNETRFFKDRNWTTREFQELLSDPCTTDKKLMLEVGCGVGNLIFPLVEEDKCNNYFIYACDFSPRAVDFVKQHNLYNEDHMLAFTCDITTKDVFATIPEGSLDIITMIFVLSAIHPDKFETVISNLYELLRPGGILLFRDYGLYDMAQLRFKPGHKIAENFYMRQDGTRSYFFADQEVAKLIEKCGFKILCNNYINRRTINPKENIDLPRIFLQGKYLKPADDE